MTADEPVLCYVTKSWAYFTTQALAKQRGDDWNDAPYEHNAGLPYTWRADRNDWPKWELTKVAWDGPFGLPCSYYTNSPHSVDSINCGACPWLLTNEYAKARIAIWAGTCLADFERLVRLCGGHVYQDSRGCCKHGCCSTN